MSRTSTVRGLSLVVGVAGVWGLMVSASVGLTQPSSRSPLAPPANGPRKSEPGDGYVALVGATVHVRPGETPGLPAVVVMRGGKIESVIPGESVDSVDIKSLVPAGAEVRDCTGMHIYAGFIEPYFEVEVPKPDAAAPGSHWNSHVMPQRNALDKGAAGISAKDAETMRSMGFVAAAISPKGGIFRGSGALVSLAQISGDPSDATPRVYADHVYQCVSLETSREDEDGRPVRGMPRPTEDAHWTRYPDSQMGSIALVRQTLSDADWQLQGRGGLVAINAVDALDAVGYPVNLLAMNPKVDAEGHLDEQAERAERVRHSRPLLMDADDELESLREMKIAAEFNRHADVLGSGFEFRRLEAIQRAAKNGVGVSVRFVLPLNFPKTPKVGSVGEADAVELKELINWEQAPTNPRRLDAAGLMVALTTSKVPEKLGGHKAFKEHLSTAIKSGLKPERALAMLTTNAAQVLGVSDQFGTIEKGKAASLIVADGELFTDKPDAPKKGEPGYVRAGRIVDVWIDGRRHVIAPKQRRDLGGTWEVTLTPGPKAGSNVRITFEIDDDYPPAFTLVKRTTDEAGKEQKATTKAQGLSIDENGAIKFTFDHEPFGEKGVFVSSGLIDKGDKGELVMRGESIRSGGEMLRWSAARVSTEIPKKDKTNAKGANEQPAGDEVGDKDKEKDKPKKSKTAEADAIAAIPEQLGLPLGPYANVNVPFQRACIIKNATIWTCGPQGVIENGAILINDGKIVIVGTAEDIKKWPDMPHAISQQPWTIDAHGKHVTPGIVDCHSHTGISRGVNESGQAVTAEVRIADVTDPDSISWYRQLGAGVTTVNSLHGSANPIGGQNQINKLRWGCISPDDMHFAGAMPGIKFALGENVKQSNGDRQSTRYPVTRMGVETLMRDRFTAAREYAAAMKSDAEREDRWKKDHADQMRTKDWGWHMRAELGVAPRRDLELEALAEILEGKRIIHCHSYRQDEILMLCRIADEFGFKIGTFQHGLEVYKVADVVKTHVGVGGGASLFADWWGYKVEVQDAIPYAGPLETEVGVLTSYNSDSDEMARRLNVEAGKAAKYSHGHLSEEEALKFVTINPAKQLRIDDKVGSIEAGKDADIAIWSGPPLSSLSRCERTFVDGREMFSLEKDADLRKANQAERARIIQKVLALKDKGGDRGKKDGEDDKPGPDAGKPVDEEMASSDRRSILMQAWTQADDLRREQFVELLRRGLDPRFHMAGDCGCFGN